MKRSHVHLRTPLLRVEWSLCGRKELGLKLTSDVFAVTCSHCKDQAKALGLFNARKAR